MRDARCRHACEHRRPFTLDATQEQVRALGKPLELDVGVLNPGCAFGVNIGMCADVLTQQGRHLKVRAATVTCLPRDRGNEWPAHPITYAIAP